LGVGNILNTPPAKRKKREAGGEAETDRLLGAAEFARERLGFRADEKQAAVLDSDAKRGILNCTRQWGKSTVSAAKAVHRAWTQPESLVLVASPTKRQSSMFLRKAAEFLAKLGVQRRGDGDNDSSLLLPNGSRIVGLPGTEATVRGFAASMVFVDEAAIVRDDLYAAMLPMLAVSNGNLWLMSTPRGASGFFYDAWQEDGWEKHSATVMEASWIHREVIEAHRRSMPEWRFRQEYFCEFTQSDDALFDREMVVRAVRQGEIL
jgi:hypothetical protein